MNAEYAKGKRSMKDSTRKAIDKYNKEKMVSVFFRVNKNTDKDVLEFLQTITNKRAYFLRMIRSDIASPDDHAWFLHLDTAWNGDENGRTIQLVSKSETDAIAEAKQIMQMFKDFVTEQDGSAEWLIYRAAKDQSSPIGYTDVGEPIIL